jgi:hypothetical protein
MNESRNMLKTSAFARQVKNPGLTFKRLQAPFPVAEKESAMESMTFSLCSECDHCPQVAVEADHVKIGEADNMVRLSHAEWNQLVALLQGGQLGTLD